jgi:DegV family protein with EDD domain
MSEYILSTCSTVDMPKDYLDERDIKYLYFHFTLDGKDYQDDFGQTVPYKDFYNKIREGAMPTTSQVNVEEYLNFFEPYLEQGLDILHLSFSSGLSGSVNSAKVACAEMSKKYPARKIYVVDTLCASSGFGMLVDAAYDKKQAGMDITKLYNWVEDNKLNVNHWVRANDLFHLKRGGRVSGASAVIGSMLKIKPIIDMNFEGRLIPRDKVAGGKKSLNAIVEKMVERAEGRLNYSGKVFICHSDNIEGAEYVAELVRKTFPKIQGEIMINSIGTVIGSHTGVGTVSVFFFGDKRVN